MLTWLMKLLVNRDLDEANQRVELGEQARALLNDSAVSELTGENRDVRLRAAHEAVCDGLRFPEAARFAEERVKAFEDGRVAVQGTVTTVNMDAAEVSNGYLVILSPQNGVLVVLI
jgi:hypothetical protein